MANRAQAFLTWVGKSDCATRRPKYSFPASFIPVPCEQRESLFQLPTLEPRRVSQPHDLVAESSGRCLVCFRFGLVVGWRSETAGLSTSKTLLWVAVLDEAIRPFAPPSVQDRLVAILVIAHGNHKMGLNPNQRWRKSNPPSANSAMKRARSVPLGTVA